jgi:hypothetical protein
MIVGAASATIFFYSVISAAPSTEKLCKNIDQRLPCSVPDLMSEESFGEAFGQFIGASTKDQINLFYNSPDGCPIFQDLYRESPTFSRFINEWFDVHTAHFPETQAELIAMAASAGIPSTTAFMQNACSELYLLFGDDVKVSSSPIPINDPPIYAPYLFDNEMNEIVHNSTSTSRLPLRKTHCSDLGLIISDSNGGGIIQGHNEDWWSAVAHWMSMVHTPAWSGYIYPGQLPGTSLVVTAKGLSLTMNSMFPTVPGYSANSATQKSGVAFSFAYPLRSIINASTVDEILNRLSQFPIYSGYSLNVMSACDHSLTNVEGYGNRLNVQSRKSKRQAGVIGHYNAYINSNVAQDADATSTSFVRRECEHKSSFNSAADIRAFLGNLSCPVFYTDLNGDHSSETMATFIIDAAAADYTMYRLPADCDERESRCYPEVQNPKTYKWSFECVLSQR